MSKFAMASGKLIDVNNFTANDVDIDDIAHHLSKIQRFNGATAPNISYTVGEHCINLVNSMRKCHFCPETRLYALMHDASEAYLGDLVSTFKHNLPDYVHYEGVISYMIESMLVNYPSTETQNTVKTYDKRILIDEVRALMPERLELYKEETGLEGLGCDIMFNNHPGTTKTCFLTMYKKLTKECGL